jgi:hypothetical protein
VVGGHKGTLRLSYADFFIDRTIQDKKSTKALRYPTSKASGECTADLQTKHAVIPSFTDLD